MCTTRSSVVALARRGDDARRPSQPPPGAQNERSVAHGLQARPREPRRPTFSPPTIAPAENAAKAGFANAPQGGDDDDADPARTRRLVLF
jgi:hypothetical protein